MQAARMKPKKGDIAFSAADAMRKEGDLAGALEYYELALKAEPKHAKFLVAVALTRSV
jgi:hypothetical protein